MGLFLPHGSRLDGYENNSSNDSRAVRDQFGFLVYTGLSVSGAETGVSFEESLGNNTLRLFYVSKARNRKIGCKGEGWGKKNKWSAPSAV
ncbi:hypothetical protein AVEN_37177-1 [Araneus ventricosus]|uniref:Uncharacterized protein n=1 Tax=Araneus ventricosus TaxID=182803 RepID=A0A4Y2F5M7_ARAVE|nr:hypothetical protein AVEN_37177-1 [Araneus ventricosus]